MRKMVAASASLGALLLIGSACTVDPGTRSANGAMMEPFLAGHEYDPISDAVVSWEIRPGQEVGQSFKVGPSGGSLGGFRLKLMRVGQVPALRYRIGRQWGDGSVLSGEIPAEQVSRFFEKWCGVDVESDLQLEAGEYVLQLEVTGDSTSGHYEVFGTNLQPIDSPRLRSHYQYLPAYGETPEITELENPMNIDLGAETPTYPGGTAIDGGEPMASMDFAFQISTVPGRREGGEEERFSFIDDELLSSMHSRPLVKSQQPAGDGEVEITSEWRLLYPVGSGAVVREAVSDFRKFLRVELSLDLVAQETEVSESDGDRTLVLGTREHLPDLSSELDRSEAFHLLVDQNRVLLCGYDERGVMRGLLYLEDLMELRRAAILEQKTETRRPRYTPRITTAPFYAQAALEYPDDAYTDEFLSRISHYGFNAVWVWGDLFDVGRSDVFPELDIRTADRQRRMREISQRGQKYGVDLIIILACPPLTEEFFQQYPEVRGTPLRAYGGQNVLCTSTEIVRSYMREATENLFREVPLLRGAAMIVGGEGFIHCYTRRMDCPRCSKRSAAEVVAELAGTIRDGAQAARPDAAVAIWPYSASNQWSKADITQSEVLEKLPEGVTLLTEFGKEGLVTFGTTTIPAYDYPISYLGPSERFVEQARITQELGIPLWIKAEHAIALEMIQTPYIPVFSRWAERFRSMAEFDWATGLFANWMHYGFMPSIAADIANWHSWSPLPDSDLLLKKIARRDFGPGTEGFALAAWKKWSEAISHYPFSGRMAMGPIQKGPAHPLFWDPDYRPSHHYGRQFKNDLSWTEPWGSEVALGQLEKLEAGWSEGVTVWESVEENALPQLAAKARREGNVARALQACIRSVVHVGRFYQLRGRLYKESEPEGIEALLTQLEEIARRELANAQAALPLVAQDSRIGYVNSGKGETIGAARGGLYSAVSVRKKIRQVQRLLDEQLPEYRKVTLGAMGE